MKFLKRFISIEDLVDRWELTEKQIGIFINEERRKNPELTMWYAEELRECGDGTTTAFVKPARYLSGCIFDMNDILRLEEQYPGLVGLKLEVRGRPLVAFSPVVAVAPPVASSEKGAQVSPPAPPPKRTAAANNARAENKLAVWKELFPCMVRIYTRMEQGRTYTRKEVAELFQGEGVAVSISKAGKVTDARLDYFWKLFTSSGRPIADLSKCGSPDVSAATTTDPLPDDN